MPTLREALQDPTIYPEPTTTVEGRETHISVVFLTDHYAYKIKKPLELGFLDYSTLDRRRFYCQQEFDLNRRLSFGVYLEVLPIHQDNRHYTFTKTGPVVEYAVKMRRLPAERTLQARLQRQAGTPAMIEALRNAS
jgi:aminoglycoside phosphotransferase family enzyme